MPNVGLTDRSYMWCQLDKPYSWIVGVGFCVFDFKGAGGGTGSVRALGPFPPSSCSLSRFEAHAPRILKETSIWFPVLLLRSVILMQLVSAVVSFTVLTLQGSPVLVLENAVDDRFFAGISNALRLQVLLQSPPKRWHQS